MNARLVKGVAKLKKLYKEPFATSKDLEEAAEEVSVLFTIASVLSVSTLTPTLGFSQERRRTYQNERRVRQADRRKGTFSTVMRH